MVRNFNALDFPKKLKNVSLKIQKLEKCNTFKIEYIDLLWFEYFTKKAVLIITTYKTVRVIQLEQNILKMTNKKLIVFKMFRK